MTIKKNDYVKFMQRGMPTVGIVKKGGATPHVLFIRDGVEYITKGPASRFAPALPSDAPKGLKPAPSLKKGMWVTFEEKGETQRGVVVKGGTTPTVAFVMNGQDLEVRGSSRLFTEMDEKDIPNLVTSDVMKDYKITGYKSLGYGHDSEVFKCTVVYKGKKVAEVSNDGWGGCDSIHSLTNNYDPVKAFVEATEKWAKSLSEQEKIFEPMDAYIHWHNVEKVFGVSDKAYWEKRDAQHKEWSEKYGR